MRKFLVIAVACSLASGCGVLARTKTDVTHVDPVDAALMEAASGVSADARLYGRPYRREVVVPVVAESEPMDGPLREPVDLKYAGDIVAVASALATFVGWSLEVEGSRRPVLVRVDAVGLPVGSILRDIGMQAGTSAMVIVDADEKSITLSFSEWRVER